MADAVTSEYIFNGRRRKVLHLTGVSDTTGESGVIKVDVSALTIHGSITPTYCTVDMIDYNIQGYDSIRFFFDANTDDEVVDLPAGNGTIDFNAVGGKTDPKSTGWTGDIKMSSFGGVSGGTYDITLYLRPKP